jgi:hypothetical protein
VYLELGHRAESILRGMLKVVISDGKSTSEVVDFAGSRRESSDLEANLGRR